MSIRNKLQTSAVAVTAAAGAMAVTVSNAFAQGLGTAWTTGVTDLQPGMGDIFNLVIYGSAVVLGCVGLYALNRLGNRSAGAHAAAVAFPLVAAFAIVNLGHFLYLGSTDVTGASATSVSGTTVTPLAIQ